MNRRATLVAGLCCYAALAQSPEPSQPPGDERLRLVQQRRSSLELELKRLRSEEQSLLAQVEGLELEVRLRGERLKEAQLLLARTNAELDATLVKVRALEASLTEARPVLRGRARALYKLGELSYVRLLLSVDRPADLFRGYRFVGTVARHDRERFAGFRRDLGGLETTRTQLEQRTREAMELRVELERTRRDLDGQRARKTALLTRIVERKETHAAYVDELRQAEERLTRLLSGLEGADAGVPIAALRGALPWPAAGTLRLGFGRRKHPRFDTYTPQNGWDLETGPEAAVLAVHEGQVAFADHFRGYGLMVIVDHGGKHHSLYARLSAADVKVGQHLVAGERIGAAGTIEPNGAGLYFEMRHQGRPEDPADWLKRAEGH